MKKIMQTIAIAMLCTWLSNCTTENNQQLQVRDTLKLGLSFPDNISPIYYLEKISISSPIILRIDSVVYITNESTINETMNKDSLKSRFDVIRYADINMTSTQSSSYDQIYNYNNNSAWPALVARNDHTITFNSKLEKIVNGIEIWKFIEVPKFFCLVLSANILHEIDHHDSGFVDVKYSKQYTLGLVPITTLENICIDYDFALSDSNTPKLVF